MSDLAHLCYPVNNDTLVEISRHYGFFRKEKAAQAKLEIAQGLTQLIHAANGTVEGNVKATSSRWWYNTDTLTALVNDTELEISIGARHKRKATQSLPCAGIFSELAVSIFTYQNPQQFMQTPLAKEMKKYLSQYGAWCISFVVEQTL